MIAAAGVSILTSAFWQNADKIILAETDWSMVIFLICLILLIKAKWNPILVMLLAGMNSLVPASGGMRQQACVLYHICNFCDGISGYPEQRQMELVGISCLV